MKILVYGHYAVLDYAVYQCAVLKIILIRGIHIRGIINAFYQFAVFYLIKNVYNLRLYLCKFIQYNNVYNIF